MTNMFDAIFSSGCHVNRAGRFSSDHRQPGNAGNCKVRWAVVISNVFCAIARTTGSLTAPCSVNISSGTPRISRRGWNKLQSCGLSRRMSRGFLSAASNQAAVQDSAAAFHPYAFRRISSVSTPINFASNISASQTQTVSL